jgi:transposase-like protein/transcription elongation factor Elf1
MYSITKVKQFRRKFRTEKDCIKYLIKRKWPEGFRCPRCGHEKATLITTRKTYQCKQCHHQTSVIANTIFHKTRKPLRDWFWAIFIVATRTTGSSARQLQHDLDISYPTAWCWCHKIRKAMSDRDTRYSLNGFIELDDAYIGGKNKPGKRGRGASGKTAVMVAVESRPKGCGHVALFQPDRVTSEQAKAFLCQKVQRTSSIVSDGFSSYQAISGDFNIDCVPLHDPQKAAEVLPNVHRVISRLKTWIRGTHTHVSGKHLNQYLSEFAYRFNRRFDERRKTIFDRLITAGCNTKAITYNQLVAELN